MNLPTSRRNARPYTRKQRARTRSWTSPLAPSTITIKISWPSRTPTNYRLQTRKRIGITTIKSIGQIEQPQKISYKCSRRIAGIHSGPAMHPTASRRAWRQVARLQIIPVSLTAIMDPKGSRTITLMSTNYTRASCRPKDHNYLGRTRKSSTTLKDSQTYVKLRRAIWWVTYRTGNVLNSNYLKTTMSKSPYRIPCTRRRCRRCNSLMRTPFFRAWRPLWIVFWN